MTKPGGPSWTSIVDKIVDRLLSYLPLAGLWFITNHFDTEWIVVGLAVIGIESKGVIKRFLPKEDTGDGDG